MEKLEKVLEEESTESPKEERKDAYSGLKLIETLAYKGGTSIKYWM